MSPIRERSRIPYSSRMIRARRRTVALFRNRAEKRAIAVGVVGGAAMALTQCSSAEPDLGLPAASTSSAASAASTPESVGIQDGGDGSIARTLEAAGYTSSDVRRLGVVAMETGYLWTTRAPTVEEQANFAYSAYLECQDVAAGDKTWEQSRSAAVTGGTSSSDAITMTNYLERTFCPIGVTLESDEDDPSDQVDASEDDDSWAGDELDDEGGSEESATWTDDTGDDDDWSSSDSSDDPWTDESTSSSTPTKLPGALHASAFKSALRQCPSSDMTFMEVEGGYPLTTDLLLLEESEPTGYEDDSVAEWYEANECVLTALGLPKSLRQRVAAEDEGEGTWKSANGATWALTWFSDGTVIDVSFDAKERAYWLS